MIVAVLLGLPSALAQAGAEPAWQYAVFGSSPGEGGILADDSGPVPRVILAAGIASRSADLRFWSRLEPDSGSGLRHAWVSPHQGFLIRRMAYGDLDGTGSEHLVVAHASYFLSVFEADDGPLILSIRTLTRYPGGLAVADLDFDGRDEILVNGAGAFESLEVYDGTGQLLWTSPGLGGQDLLVAQFDGDPALEVVSGEGVVLDTVTRLVEWTAPSPFGVELDSADVDGDGIHELFSRPDFGSVRSHDLVARAERWSLPSAANEAIEIVDLENDGAWELLHGVGGTADVVAYDAFDGRELFRIPNPNEGVSDLQACDLDRDGLREIIWGSKRTHSGGDALYIFDGATHALEWASPSLTGPFLDPQFGDLDGDLVPELVSASAFSDEEKANGRVLVFTPPEYRSVLISAPVTDLASGPIRDLELRDYDHDGTPEILIATERRGKGIVQAYGLSAGAIVKEWENADRANTSIFTAVEAADVDHDGDREVVVACQTGFLNDGLRVIVYDARSGAEEWRSADLGFDHAEVLELRMFDLDGDGMDEICGYASASPLFALDGVSRLVEFTDGYGYSCLEVYSGSRGEFLLLGDSLGTVHVYGPRSGNGFLFLEHSVSNDYIGGISQSLPGRLWLQVAGNLELVDWASGAVLWRAPSYYSFGRKVAQPGAVPRFFVAGGTYCLTGFRRE